MADLNLDDSAMIAPPILVPGQQYAKGWQVKNTCTCAWAPDFALAYVSGQHQPAVVDTVARHDRGQGS